MRLPRGYPGVDSGSLSTHGPLTTSWSTLGKGHHEYPLMQAVRLHESLGPRVVWVKWYSPAGCKNQFELPRSRSSSTLKYDWDHLVVRYNSWIWYGFGMFRVGDL